MNKLDIHKSLRNVVDNIIKQTNNEDNIIIVDDNIVLYSTYTYDKDKSVKTFRRSKLKQYRIKEEDRFIVFTKDGMLFGEEVDLVARVLNINGDMAGYLFRLADIKEKPSNETDSDTEKRKLNSGIIMYINESILESIEDIEDDLNIDDLYFIGNDIDNEIIENSLCEVYKDIEIINFGTSYVMTFKGKKYRFSSDTMLLNNKNRQFANIGKFLPM